MIETKYEDIKGKLIELDERKKALEKVSTKEFEEAKLKLETFMQKVVHLTELINLTNNEVITEGTYECGLNVIRANTNYYTYSVEDDEVTEDYKTVLHITIDLGDYSAYGYNFYYPMFGATQAEKREKSVKLIEQFIISFEVFEEITMKKIEEYISESDKYIKEEERKLEQ